MGMYTGLRFKAIIKKEYRDDIEIMLNNKNSNSWLDCNHKMFKKYSKVSRSDFIPFGSICYMPDCWEGEPYDKKTPWDCPATDGFERYFNKETGLLCFQCSLKNYDDTIEIFLNTVAKEIVQESIHIEVLYEEDSVSTMYDIAYGELKQLDYGIRYENDDYDYCLFCKPKKNEINIYYEDYDFTKEDKWR